MKKLSLFLLCFSAVLLTFASTTAEAGLVLAYDSLLPGSGGSNTSLSRIDSVTDTSLVASSVANNVLGGRATMAAVHNSQTNVQGANGDQNDLIFRFGSSAGGNGTLGGALTPGHAAAGARIDFRYTAATTQTLEDFSFNLFNNSNNGSSYGARDAGLFVQVAGGGFTQFGSLFTSATGNGNQGQVSFMDSFLVSTGELVEFRLAFTDRTRTNNDLQAGTRIGNVLISATAIPEPSSFAMFAALGLFGFRRRR